MTSAAREETSTPRKERSDARIGSGLLVTLATGVAGTASAWGLLQWAERDAIRRIAEVTGVEPTPWVEPHDAVAFGALVAGLSLLSWLLASRPGAVAWRSLVHTGGTFVAWTAIAWSFLLTAAPVWWPGPVAPLSLDGQGQLVPSAAPAAYLGPLVVLVAIVASVCVGSRLTPREAGPTTPRPPSRLASRATSGLVGAGVLLGLVGAAALVVTDSAMGTAGWADLAALADRQLVLTTAATAVAWLVSGAARGNAFLVLVASVAVLGGGLATESTFQAGAALLGIATASVASAHRPLATALDRLTL